MSIVLSGVVKSCAHGMFQVEAQVNGKPVVAMVPGLTIEVAGESRCFTLDVVDGLDEAENAFPPGTNVTLTLETA